MANERHYEAKKYAHSLDYSYGRYPAYYKALITNIDSARVSKDVFMEIVCEARLNLSEDPDATSVYPRPIKWWNVDLPNYVLIARDDKDAYWAFTMADEQIMKQLDEAYADIDAKRATAGR